MSGRTEPKPATILVVDDDPGVLSVIQALLESRGHTVLPAASGEQAWSVFQPHRSTLDLAIVDVVMPGLSGPDLAARLVASRPDLAVLFISGRPDDARVRELIANRPSAFLAKPFTIRDLEANVTAVLKARTPSIAHHDGLIQSETAIS